MKYLLNLAQALLFVVVGCCGTVLANNGREVRFEARSSSAGGGLRRLSRHDERRLMMSSKSMMSKSKMSSSSSRSERTDAPTADATMGGTEVPDISGSSRSKSKSMMSKSMMSKSKSSSSSRSQRTDAPTTGVTMDGTDGPSVRSRSSSKSKSMMSKSMMSKSKPSSRSQRTDAPTAGMTDGPVVTMNPTNAATDAPGQGDGDGPIVPPGDEAPVEETAAPTEALPTPPPTSPAGLGPPRPDDFECQENPQDYNVNIDVQIEYPDDEFAACDDEAQDSNINAVISDALNAAFPTTVSDWDGDALFGDFVFDGDQEVNNVDPFGGFRRKRYLRVFTRPSQIDDKRRRRLQEGTCPSRADVECTTDYCRWGCVTAATTDCGTSSLVNWPNLAEDIRAELAALGYDCLGIPDQLQVVLLVDDPEAPGAARSFSSNSLADNPEGEKVDENDNENDNENPDENVNDNVNEDPNALLVNSEAEQDEAVNDATTATFSINSELDFEVRQFASRVVL